LTCGATWYGGHVRSHLRYSNCYAEESIGSDLVAAIDADTCSACGVWAEARCPMEPIVTDNGAYRVSRERCIEYGVCTITCPTDSITLEHRAQRHTPPENMTAWSAERAVRRGLDLGRS
jgi:electron transport complex protein RnfB